ncbi:MAG TPA: (deoxy)nucleoside triphosphate pyrophosphohydrolase [Polyangiaceae bacterium]
MTLLVAAAVLIENGRVLLTQRKRGTHLEGLWEFPGGKVEDGEDPKDALARELREEIGIDAEVGEIIEVTFHRYEAKSVLLLFYAASRRAASVEPHAIDVAALEWADASALDPARFPAADVSVLAKVRALLA